MVGQSSNKKLADILLVYGYHENETFHQDVIKELQKENLPNVRYVKYDWKRPHGNRRNVYLAFNNFVKKYLPADYVIDLHDTPHSVGKKGTKHTYFSAHYDSHVEESPELIKDLNSFRKYLEEFNDGHVITPDSVLLPFDYQPHYPSYVVELFPEYSTFDEGVMQMEGFISILSRHPQKTSKTKKSL